MNYTTFHITWATLPKEAVTVNIIMYEVRLFSNTSCTTAGLITYETLNASTTEVLLSNLSMCTAYEVAVRAYTIVGPGPYSKPIMLQTLGELFYYESRFSVLTIQKYFISRLVPSRYLRVLWGKKIGVEDGLRRAGDPYNRA